VITNKSQELGKKVIALIEQGKGFAPSFISNEAIYREVTGLRRFSKKKWAKLKLHIKAINGFKMGNRELHGYDPMLRRQYNVKATDSPNDFRYIAGFQLVIRKPHRRGKTK